MKIKSLIAWDAYLSKLLTPELHTNDYSYNAAVLFEQTSLS